MKIEDLFFFAQKAFEMQCKSSFHCTVERSVTSKDELFDTLNKQFKFPVFGWNWDALNDALCDLAQIKEQKIIIYHDKICMDSMTLSTYLSCLTTAALIWKKYSYKHIFIPVFKIEDKDNIIKILHSSEINEEFNILKEQIKLPSKE